MSDERSDQIARGRVGAGAGLVAAPVRNYIGSTSPGARAVKARVVRIGNSRGIRLPKPVIEQLGLAGEVDMHVADGVLTIRPVASVREGWAAAFKALAAGADGGLLDPPTSTRFDREEWEW